MKHDVIVVGLGIIGSAVTARLAREGYDVLGIDKGAQGSSHGTSRLIRRSVFNAEHYLPLIEESFDAWRRIEDETGDKLITTTGLYLTGSHDDIENTEDKLDSQGVAWERRVHPRLGECVYDPGAGYINASAAVDTFQRAAVANGATLTEGTVTEMDGTHVLVGGDSYDADNVVLAMGPWMHDVLDVPLHIKRKVVAWYDTDAEAFLDIQTGFYGIPGNGVKIGRHYGGRLLASPDDAEGAFTPEDAEQFAGVDTYIGEADRTDHRICYYTMTLDEDFIIDRVDVDVVVAAGFSGRGFKYAPAVARLVHDLVEGAEPVRAFRLDRFKNT